MCAALLVDARPEHPLEAPARRARRREAHYLHGPLRDGLLAFAWVPFAVVVHVLFEASAGPALTLAISAVFLLSFAHQPLTVALVYGDGENFRLRRALFLWAPPVFAVAVFVACNVSFTALTILGGLWNIEHTLMQRYGLTRIYGRKVRQDDGLVEKLLLWSWLLLALVWAAANPATPGRLERVDLGSNNEPALELLVQLAPVASVLLWPIAAAAAGLAVAWVVQERRRATVNPVKWLYLGSTAVLFGLMLVDPLAGLMGYVGAHSIEYFVIVHQSLGRRHRSAEVDGGAWLGRVVRARPGRTGFLAVYALAVVALVYGLARLGSPLAYFVVFFTLGGLHVFYDGFIWKLRRPTVARSLALPGASPA